MITNKSCFISYSHKDMKMKHKFISHMESIRRKYNIDIWHDGCIKAGQPIDQIVMSQLCKADIVFLLITADYISSYFCYEVELAKAIERQRQQKCIIVPVILKPVGGLDDLPFGHLLRVPQDGRPITSFSPRDEGYANAITKIDEMIGNWCSLKDRKEIHRNATEKQNCPQRKSPAKSKKVKTWIKDRSGKIGPQIIQAGQFKPMAISQSMVDGYPSLCEKIYTFTIKVHQYTTQVVENYQKTKNKNKIWWKKQVRIYLFEILSYIRKELINLPGVRVHFRKLTPPNYVGIVAVTGEDYDDINFVQLTPIPVIGSMIDAASKYDAPLIKSFNPDYHFSATHDDKWIDYMTCVFKKLHAGLQPILSLGISVDTNDYETKRDLLILFAHVRIDNIIQSLLIEYCNQCRIIDHTFDLKAILDEY